MADQNGTQVKQRSKYRERYDSAPTLSLAKVPLPDTDRYRHPVLTFFIHVILCIVALVVAVVVVPFLLPISLIFRLYRSVLINEIKKREGDDVIIMPGMDALWLQDSAENRTIINSVMFMTGKMDVECFEAHIKERLVDARNPANPTKPMFPKITKYATQILHRYLWKTAKNFNIKDHVFEYQKGMPETQGELKELIGEIASTPFPSYKPPWQFILIRANSNNPDKYVTMFRAHHSLGDGMALVQVLVKKLIDKEPEVISKKRHFGTKNKWSLLLKTLFEGPLLVAEVLFLRADNHVLHGKSLCGEKIVSWSDPIDLLLIKKIKNVTGTTVNDVLMSCLAASLRAYIKQHGSFCPEELLSYVPVNLRKPSDELTMDNQLVLVILPLPTHTDDPLELLAHTTEKMNEIKKSPAPLVNSAIMRYGMARLPNWLTHLVFDIFAKKCSAIISNIPGPQQHMTMTGDVIDDVMFWTPTRANVGIGVSLLSYAGNVRLGLMVDKALLSNAHVLVESFMTQVHRLAEAVNVE